MGIGVGGFESFEFLFQRFPNPISVPVRNENVRRRKDGDFPRTGQALARDDVIRLYLFHSIPEKVHADGIFRVDGIDVENIAPKRESALCLHLKTAHITHLRQAERKGRKIDVLALLQRNFRQCFREELKERVELRRYHGTALLQGFDALQTLKKRIFGKRLPIQ